MAEQAPDGETAVEDAHDGSAGRIPPDLIEVFGFGTNPGNLRMFEHVPDSPHVPMPLVVLLHGCEQTAATYHAESGWATLAEQWGFALLLPEQRRQNNAGGCFNWFDPADIRRDRGEVLSIRQMIDRMMDDHTIDRGRIFVTGLSAGGAMTAAMLATYPELFAGGAIVAGLPYGCASGLSEALTCMMQGRSLPAHVWGDHVRNASDHSGPWPRLSIWHGSLDTVVHPANAVELMKQWTDVHGIGQTPNTQDQVSGYPHALYHDDDGRPVVETYEITGMAHGMPIAGGPDGSVRGFMIESNIQSSLHIARFWGLHGTRPHERGAEERSERRSAPPPPETRPNARDHQGGHPTSEPLDPGADPHPAVRAATRAAAKLLGRIRRGR